MRHGAREPILEALVRVPRGWGEVVERLGRAEGCDLTADGNDGGRGSGSGEPGGQVREEVRGVPVGGVDDVPAGDLSAGRRQDPATCRARVR